jgi:major vault protein
VIKLVTARILEKDRTAIHLRATKTFVDTFGKERKAGDEWLVTYEDHGRLDVIIFLIHRNPYS